MDYSAALYLCLAISALLCIAWISVAALAGLRLKDAFYWLATGCFAITFGLSTFCLIFPILNIILGLNQPAVALVKAELANGVFGLRVSSGLIGFKVTAIAVNYLLAEETLWTGRLLQRPTIGRANLDDIGEYMEDWAIDVVEVTQYGLYLVTIACLWSFVILAKSSWQTAALNWALFLAVNDWIIICAYLRILKGHVYRWHRIKIAAFNLLLVLGVAIILWREFAWFVSVPVLTILLLFTFYRYAFADCAWNGRQKRTPNTN